MVGGNERGKMAIENRQFRKRKPGNGEKGSETGKMSDRLMYDVKPKTETKTIDRQAPDSTKTTTIDR